MAPRAHPGCTTSAIDFLVIGSGVAGLRAAVGLSRRGRVLILTKGGPAEGSSIYAQGGVAVAPEEDDTTRLHFLEQCTCVLVQGSACDADEQETPGLALD